MGQREYIISIDFDEQYRTQNRGQAKAFYNLVDETFEKEVDGRKKQLIQVESDGWSQKVLFQDVIHCPKKTLDEEKEEDNQAKQDFRVIVAGSRDFDDYDLLREKCDALLARKTDKNIIIVSGTARGADQLGEWYADERGYQVERYPADWENEGKAAGPIRNAKMADNADALIAFWDGESRGTENMIEEATRKGLAVRVVEIEKEEDIEEELTPRYGLHR